MELTSLRANSPACSYESHRLAVVGQLYSSSFCGTQGTLPSCGQGLCRKSAVAQATSNCSEVMVVSIVDYKAEGQLTIIVPSSGGRSSKSAVGQATLNQSERLEKKEEEDVLMMPWKW